MLDVFDMEYTSNAAIDCALEFQHIHANLAARSGRVPQPLAAVTILNGGAVALTRRLAQLESAHAHTNVLQQ
jgi:hypothetical protein